MDSMIWFPTSWKARKFKVLCREVTSGLPIPSMGQFVKLHKSTGVKISDYSWGLTNAYLLVSPNSNYSSTSYLILYAKLEKYMLYLKTWENVLETSKCKVACTSYLYIWLAVEQSKFRFGSFLHSRPRQLVIHEVHQLVLWPLSCLTLIFLQSQAVERGLLRLLIGRAWFSDGVIDCRGPSSQSEPLK